MLQKSGLIVFVVAILAFHALGKADGKTYETTEVDAKEKILGGNATHVSRHPFQVIVTNGGYMCGGTILTATHILTTAHCVYRTTGNYVVTGSSVVTKVPEIMVKQVYIHPLYNLQLLTFDIAILKLTRTIQFDALRKPANLPTRNVVDGEVATVIGFGMRNNAMRVLNGPLHATNVRVYNHDHCKYTLGSRITDYQICMKSPPGVVTCKGDSGGPLAVGNTVVGIVSYGFGACGNGTPVIFTNVYTFLRYIRKVIQLSP